MKECILNLETPYLIELLGVNNSRFELLKKTFTPLKIISRGTQIKARGALSDIENFQKKITQITQAIKNKGSVTDSQFEDFLAEQSSVVVNQNLDTILRSPYGKDIKSRTLNQQKFLESEEKNDIIFAIGPAGTGKTYMAVALAVRALKNKRIKKIILTRPAVEAGENLGFLPGDLKTKIDPYLTPLLDALQDMIEAEKLRYYLHTNVIEIAPLAYMRGRTLDNAYIILDEAQNATDLQLKMFLTRLGVYAKAIITGDLTQVDLPYNQKSGLKRAVHLLGNIKGIATIFLKEQDVVRHPLVREIIKAYEKE